MVEKYKKIIESILAERKSLTLFVVMSVDNLSESSTIIFASSWINENNSREVFEYILKLLRQNLDSEDLSKINRIGIYNKDEHSIQLFKNYNTGDSITNQQINGFDIKEGQVIYSNFE